MAYLEVQGSCNQITNVLLTRIQPGQLYSRRIKVGYNWSYGLAIDTIDTLDG